MAFPRNAVERRRQSIQFEMANYNCRVKKTKTHNYHCDFINNINIDSQVKKLLLIYKF